MVLETGDKVLVSHRRLFAEDHPRYFTGVVESYAEGIAVVTGHSWVREPFRGEIRRKPDERTKLVSLNSGSLIVYRLPRATDLARLSMRHGEGGEVALVDDRGLAMDLTERAHAA
jgi:hypothetical protein